MCIRDRLIVFGHSNSTLKDVADFYYSEDIVSENFEIIKDISKLKGLKEHVKDKNVTAIIGKSTPYQLDENLDKLVSYLV